MIVSTLSPSFLTFPSAGAEDEITLLWPGGFPNLALAAPKKGSITTEASRRENRQITEDEPIYLRSQLVMPIAQLTNASVAEPDPPDLTDFYPPSFPNQAIFPHSATIQG